MSFGLGVNDEGSLEEAPVLMTKGSVTTESTVPSLMHGDELSLAAATHAATKNSVHHGTAAKAENESLVEQATASSTEEAESLMKIDDSVRTTDEEIYLCDLDVHLFEEIAEKTSGDCGAAGEGSTADMPRAEETLAQQSQAVGSDRSEANGPHKRKRKCLNFYCCNRCPFVTHSPSDMWQHVLSHYPHITVGDSRCLRCIAKGNKQKRQTRHEKIRTEPRLPVVVDKTAASAEGAAAADGKSDVFNRLKETKGSAHKTLILSRNIRQHQEKLSICRKSRRSNRLTKAGRPGERLETICCRLKEKMERLGRAGGPM